MIKTLDKFTLTEKLVPLLAKIKTKEPSVMVATLAVHEEMGKKCEIEASASYPGPSSVVSLTPPLSRNPHPSSTLGHVHGSSSQPSAVPEVHGRHQAARDSR